MCDSKDNDDLPFSAADVVLAANTIIAYEDNHGGQRREQFVIRSKAGGTNLGRRPNTSITPKEIGF